MNQHKPLQPANNCATIQPEQTEMITVPRSVLLDLERRLIPVLVEGEEALAALQAALGKEPSIPGRGEKGLTRAERRRR
jgi:hypothetical protein